MKPKIFLGADHGGFQLKEALKPFLKEKKFAVADVGTVNGKSCDYPDIALAVSKKVQKHRGSVGILCCGTGIGMAMTANRLKGIRAAVCANEYMAKMAREHNDANVLCLGGRWAGDELAKSITEVFLKTKFESSERHKRRLKKLEACC